MISIITTSECCVQSGALIIASLNILTVKITLIGAKSRPCHSPSAKGVQLQHTLETLFDTPAFYDRRYQPETSQHWLCSPFCDLSWLHICTRSASCVGSAGTSQMVCIENGILHVIFIVPKDRSKPASSAEPGKNGKS